MKPWLPRGWLGASFGAIGSLSLLPIAARMAARFGSISALPGMERRVGDLKAVTYAEAVVLILLLPLCALLFGILLPRWFEARAAPGRLSFEWAGFGFALSLFLAQRGLRPEFALIAGSLAAIVIAAGVLAFRQSFGVRRFFSCRGRAAAIWLALSGATLDLASRAGQTAPKYLLGDLLGELVLAGLGLSILAASICAGVARRPLPMFRRLGGWAGVAIAIASAAIALPRISVPLAWVALLSLPAAAILLPVHGEPASVRRLALVALLVVSGWRILHTPTLRLDLFEDGCSLSPTQSYLNGARPYVDVIPVHGGGADGGVDAFFFRAFEPTLFTFQLRHEVWSVIAFTLLAVSSAVALGSASWGALAFLFALDIGARTIERQALAFAALLLLFHGVRRNKRWGLLAAGVFAAWELMHSLDYGLIVLVGGLAGLFLLPLLAGTREPLRAAARSGGAFLLGAALGALPFLARLARQEALPSFVRISFVDTRLWVAQVWNYPAGSAWNSLLAVRSVDGLAKAIAGSEMPALFLLLVLGATGAAMLLRAAAGSIETVDRTVCIAWAVAAVSMRAVLGRADILHLERYGLFAALPAAWLLMRLWRSGPARRPLFVGAAALVLLRLHPLQTLERELGRVEGAARRASQAEGAPAPRSGGALLPAEQAHALTAFRNFTDANLRAGETFFDFANEPGLYFVADRVAPIPYFTVPQYESEQAQHDVVAELEQRRPPFAILPTGRLGDLDRVPNADRAPLVARYLAENIATLGSKIDKATLDRFEAAFKALNSLL